MATRRAATAIHLPMRIRQQERDIFIHTYMCDSDPLPSFEGEPKLIQVPDSMEKFTELLWNSLNQENKVSLFVRYIDIETGKYETKIVNKNQK